MERPIPPSLAGDEDDPDIQLSSFWGFLRGERNALWPVWLMFGVMVLVVLWLALT